MQVMFQNVKMNGRCSDGGGLRELYTPQLVYIINQYTSSTSAVRLIGGSGHSVDWSLLALWVMETKWSLGGDWSLEGVVGIRSGHSVIFNSSSQWSMEAAREE